MGPVPPHLLVPAEDQVDTATRILDYWAPDRVRHDEEGFPWLIRNRLEKDSTHAESKIWWARALSRRNFTVLPDDVPYTAGDTLVVTRQQITTWIKAQTGAEHDIAREVAVEIDLILHAIAVIPSPKEEKMQLTAALPNQPTCRAMKSSYLPLEINTDQVSQPSLRHPQLLCALHTEQ